MMILSFLRRQVLVFRDLAAYTADRLRRKPQIPSATRKSIVILCNGPSLKSTIDDYSQDLVEIDTVCVNKFSISSYFEIIKPKYYVFLDPLFFCSDDQLSALEPQVAKDIRETFRRIIADTSWPMTIFFPFSHRSTMHLSKSIIGQNPNLKLLFYNTRNFSSAKDLWFYNRGGGIPGGMTVLHACIALAIQMGYSRIALTGADHTWFEKIKFDPVTKEMYLDDSHFNRVLRRSFKEMRTSVAFEAYTLYKCFQAYPIYKRWAASLGVNIYNCSPYSFIDEFPFLDLKEFMTFGTNHNCDK